MNKAFLILLFPLMPSGVFAQNVFVSNFTQKEYESDEYIASPQNWSMQQDSLGRIYVANSSAVLMFDGKNWYNIPGTENRDLFSLCKSETGVIYAGGKNNLGYMEIDSLGIVVFKSLTTRLSEAGIVPEGSIIAAAAGAAVYFRDKKGVIELKNQKFTFFPFESSFTDFGMFQDKLMIQDDYGNLLELDNGKIDTVFSLGNRLNAAVLFVKELPNHEFLIVTVDGAILDSSNKENQSSRISNEMYYSDFEIKDVIDFPKRKLLGLATKGSGIIFADYDGEIKKILNAERGLISNTCYSLFLDENKDLWACFDNGLSLIEYPSALSYYDITNGLTGIVTCMLKHENTIYAGTTNNLFYLENGDIFREFKIQAEIWDIKVIDDIIWAASTSGLYQIIKGVPQLILDIDTRFLLPDENGRGIWVGLSDGLGYLEKDDDSEWIWKGKIRGLEHEVRHIAQESDSVLWVSFEQVSRISFQSGQQADTAVLTLNETQGVNENFYIIESYKIRNQIYFATGAGLYRYDADEKMFFPDDSFGKRFADGEHEVFALTEDDDRNVWFTSVKTNGKLIFRYDSVVSCDTLSLARLSATEVWKIIPVAGESEVYFCTTDGLFRYDTELTKATDYMFSALINKVAIDRDSIISYLETGRPGQKATEFPYQYNNLWFRFSATTFGFDEEILFSYILRGYDKKESNWSPEDIKEYTNIPPGKYTFEVKAKNMYGIQGKTAFYSFIVLPPWYRTYWAYSIWALLLISGVITVDRVQRKRLFKIQQKRIQDQKQKLERERQISNKLRKVDKLKDEFLANTSHELRTPLNGIIGITESLYEESDQIKTNELKNNLAMVIASGRRLASMVDGILDYSKLKTKNLDLKKKPIDLRSIVSVVLTMSRPIISRGDLKLINEVPADLPFVEADENRLQQILYNLVGNAVKFTPGGTIAVSAKLCGDFAEVSVIDDGIGIPEDKTDKIFDSFEQVDAEINREYIGTGLGLTITKRLVELHNGTIRVESKLREGSKFIFTLPLCLQESPTWSGTEMIHMEEPEVTPSLDAKVDAQTQILIVDDDSINRQVIANHLKHEPFFLEMATNGPEALDKISNKKYDLILLDVMMPKMSGFEVSQKIREKYLLSELPIIFITAKDQVSDLVEGLRYGGNDYITKPFSKSEFLARIKTQLKLEKINDSYARFIPREFLKSLGRESIMDVNLGDRTEKEVTILFSDIRDYTTISEKMSPKENFEFLNSFLSAMGPVISDNNGFVMQYLGDGLMSVFLHDPRDAVNAAAEMLNKIEDLNNSEVNTSGHKIEAGMGLHTGKLIMGVIGDNKRMDINVVSDSVNTASRMEGLTKHYGTSAIMSETTLRGMKNNDGIQFRFLGLVRVKGKTQPLRIYEILNVACQLNRIKIETKETFETGLTHYFERDFIKAATELKKVTVRNPNDVTAQMYLKLSAKYMVEGVQENWTGVETMLLK